MRLFRDIALFVEVVKTKSFTRAAKNLEMPASTLSRRISGLEKDIGLRLLSRTTRRVEVTEAGAAYYARCAHLVEEARIAHEQLAETVSVAKGTLRLACPSDFATLRLPPLLVEFTRQHPAVNVELELSSRIPGLSAENLDAALHFGPLADSALITRKIATLQHALYAAPSYLAIAPALTHPEDLARHVCIRIRSDEEASSWRLINAEIPGSEKDFRVQVTGRFVVSSISMRRQLTLLGAGIAVIDEAMAREDVERGHLRRVLPGWSLPPITLHMLTPSRLGPARVRLFGDFLAERLAPGWT